MMYYSKVADRETFAAPVKKVEGKAMILVATKTSRRTMRKRKTQYIYSMEGTKGIYYNESKNGVLFVPMARREHNMKKHYDFGKMKGKKNPYIKQLKQPITIRLDKSTVAYFKALATELGMPYQNLINLYLRDCVLHHGDREYFFSLERWFD